MSSNQRNQKTAELIDKMCRKISQLTRVVYVLNSKNDEHESLIDALAQAYEKELSNSEREKNISIKKMKSQIEKIKIQNNPEQKILEINKKFDNQVNSFNKEYDKLKKDMKSKQKNIQDEYNEKYNKMIKENVEMKKLYENKINDILKRVEDEKKKWLLEKEIASNANESEIEKLKRKYEEQIINIKNKKRS